jgi:hypothetical protein
MSEMIYKQVQPTDHNPETRSWYYDDFGNRVDKKTGQFVILIDDSINVPTTLLTEH